MADQIEALQGLISNLVVNAHDIIPKLGGTKVINESIVDVQENNVLIKKCFLQVNTVDTDVSQPSQSRDIVEISDDVVEEINKLAEFPKSKRKKKTITEVSIVRRSERISKHNGGYKDAASCTATSFIPLAEQEEADGDETMFALDLAPKFEVVAIDHDAPPPPFLPMKTVQAIGTGLC
jgi:hypothetical protein